MGFEFLLKDANTLLKQIGEARRILSAFWAHPKSGNPYDPETALLMHSALERISGLFGVRRR